ncbi:MAG: lysine 2,3-aminomutase [Pseudorhodobacter sp.]|jgi:lysine 2,3-aminomutase
MAALTTVDDLIGQGLAAPEAAEALTRVAEVFKLRITDEMQTALAIPGVARQFLPSPLELTTRPEELYDPIGDRAHAPTPGLTHRYRDRVILHATQTCEVYCRFCFRRETVGSDGTLPDADLDAALDYIAQTPAIWEVILTGGDPLVLSPRRLSGLIARLAQIPHVEVVRFHTRVPVVAPEKVTAALVDAMQSRLTPYLVIHTNHPDELTPNAQAALAQLARGGITLLSQTVLLRGVNDEAEVLGELFRNLIRNRVKPYYLHHCDLARGTSHFRTTIAEGQAIMATLRRRFSGICLPSYVLDIPGGKGKIPIGPDYLTAIKHGQWQVTDPQGEKYLYQDPSR